uniref:TRP C-terminal domain-containing protein n=2 Tax=Amphimedon queenslandica TaxID=400682 RepID=A0A1X7U264_AMPQE
MAIKGSSVVALSPSANLEFIDNHASLVGGGIYIDEESCFQFKQGSSSIPLTLKDNTAGVAGNDIYGFIGSFNYFNLTNPKDSVLSNFRFFFCDPDSNETISNDTGIYETQNYDEHEQQIFPGQLLEYNVALFVFNFNNGTFIPTNQMIIIKIDGVPVEHVYINGSCSLIEYTPYKLTYTRHEIALIMYHHKIQSYFIFNECPIGFRENSSGVCDCSVSRENVTCDINTLDITHNGLLWIGTYHTSTPFNANETNPNACIINEDCLLYCSPNPVTFQLNDTDTQCVDTRGQRMCGSCRDGYSLLMGSNKCGQCHNNYMMIAWIALFAVMGVLLVVLLIALNLTVSVGTLNGLLFYANIVKLYEPVFSRKGALPVLSQVISWINLDFGFEICFYNGMDSFAKQWLQFAFPLYLWIIIIIIIQLCKRYGKVSRLMGSHAVPVLSTLFLLSYTKLVRTIVIVLHKREVTLHCTNESVRSVSLWYEDPNVEYAKGKHAGLFGFALLVSVFFVIPYTLFLLCHPVFEKHLSHFKLFKNSSRFKPIIDAYSGPMKDEYRFWPGLLLVARIPVLLSVTLVDSFIQSHYFLLSMLLTVLVIVLSLGYCFGGVYKERMNNVLEVWFLFNLCIMAGLSIAFNEDSKVLIWCNTCLSVFIFSFILIVVYHLYLQLSHMKCYHALIKKLFKKQDEDDDPLLDVTQSHITVDQQRRQIVPSSTDVRLSNSRESVVDLF